MYASRIVSDILRSAAGARWLSILCLLALLPLTARAESASREYQVKAAFLFNFAQFVEWPAEAFADAAAPIRIGVLGDDPFGQTLEDMVRGETVRERSIEVQRGRRVDELGGCHLLFISRSERARVAGILGSIALNPVLTVSELDDFAAQGGGIRLYLVGTKVRFEINPDLVQRQRLKVSSQLLSLGTIAAPGRQGEGR